MYSKLNKIHIIGPVGSGKTYLAKILSNKLSIEHYQLDNFVYNGCIRNTIELREKLLSNTIVKDSWIIEGVHHKWVHGSFCEADIIIYLIPSILKRDFFIIKRFLKQKFKIEKGNYNQNIEELIQLFKWNHNHNKNELLKILDPYKEKLLIIKDNKQIDIYLNKWRNTNE